MLVLPEEQEAGLLTKTLSIQISMIVLVLLGVEKGQRQLVMEKWQLMVFWVRVGREMKVRMLIVGQVGEVGKVRVIWEDRGERENKPLLQLLGWC